MLTVLDRYGGIRSQKESQRSQTETWHMSAQKGEIIIIIIIRGILEWSEVTHLFVLYLVGS